jgi:hypothetical protein
MAVSYLAASSLLEAAYVIAADPENGIRCIWIPPSAGASSLPESRWVPDEGEVTGSQTFEQPVLFGNNPRCLDRKVAEFLSGCCPWLPEPAARRLRLFRDKDLRCNRRTWRLHRQRMAAPEGEEEGDGGTALLPRAPAPASLHHAMLIVLLPQSYSQHLGGEMEVGEPLASPPAQPLLVILPAGLPFRWRPLRAGVRYWMSSPLDVPDAMASPPVPVRCLEEPRPTFCASVPELEGALRRVRARMAALREEEAALEGQLRAVAKTGLTRTLAEIDNRLSLSPPFVVILRERYDSAQSPSLRGDDALTFVGLVRRFPGSEPRLLNVAVHLPAEEAEGAVVEDGEISGRRETWEAAISECPGWVGEEMGQAGEDDVSTGGPGDAARLLRGLPCVYGGDDLPGAIESVTAKEIANLRWSVVLVAGVDS